MHAIVGIGNPGQPYKNNRHNVGFQFLDYFAEKNKLAFKASKFYCYYSEGELQNNPFVLIKPSTYVNLSGVAVLKCINFFNIDTKNLLVILDDVNIELGTIRIRKSGGDGGHNGLSSIIYHLNTNDFPRLRIGIGNNFTDGNLPDYVLSDFSIEMKKLNSTFEQSTQFIISFISGGIDNLLNTYSRSLNKNL